MTTQWYSSIIWVVKNEDNEINAFEDIHKLWLIVTKHQLTMSYEIY